MDAGLFSDETHAAAVYLTSPLTLKADRVPGFVLKGTSRCVNDFEKLNRIGEGTYGIVCS